ncbi:hypothetical protein, partial [Paractinoplanes ferrugineus]|uniref:hypothetical protein n=1 Tax=Paractinoplanes ferrugineus TaxID=113564 RepID=UPI001944940E
MEFQQLSFFSRPVTVALRDRTRARNWSPGNDEFRREHERHRRWGLARRYGWKTCRSHGCSRQCGELDLHDSVEAVPPLIWPADATLTRRPTSPAVAAERDLSSAAAQPDVVDAVQAESAPLDEAAPPIVPESRMELAPEAEMPDQATPPARPKPSSLSESGRRLEFAGEPESARSPESELLPES